ncbi:MAG: hypothetical protein R3200_06445 [Xanthomonadales bacterium]|nr:hypothetical protein [Xanthomonadales bacterium]
MSLLEFAKGPALNFALVVFLVGVLWRLLGIALMRFVHPHTEARSSFGKAAAGGLRTVGSRSWPHPEFVSRTGYGEALGYSYHIGLIVVVLFFAPHVQFFKSLFGVEWASLPSGWIDVISIVTVALLIAVLLRRLTNPVLKRISNFDDYFSWFVTVLVLVTGILATLHLGGPYETLLALHILSFNLLLIWFPFGKLMHAFFIVPSRWINGYFLNRKGAAS